MMNKCLTVHNSSVPGSRKSFPHHRTLLDEEFGQEQGLVTEAPIQIPRNKESGFSSCIRLSRNVSPEFLNGGLFAWLLYTHVVHMCHLSMMRDDTSELTIMSGTLLGSSASRAISVKRATEKLVSKCNPKVDAE
eukprot:282501-Pelagomonas_calceolata.AAC.2